MPDLDILPLYRSDYSYSNEDVGTWLTQSGAWEHRDRTINWPEEHGEGIRGSADMIERLRQVVGALAYVGPNAPSDVIWVSLVNADGQTYAPDGPEVARQLDNSPKPSGRSENDHARKLDSVAVGVYPLLQVSYLVVCEQYNDPATAELVRGVFSWILSPEGHATAPATATTPFSADVYDNLAASIAAVS